MDLRQLRYFLAIADAGSLSNAARSLFVTQPTLTVALRKLEAELNASLFHRGEAGYELTDAGRLLYDEGSAILDHVADLENRIRHADQPPPEAIRVGLTVLFSIQFMHQISRYLTSHLNVEVTLVHGGSRELQGALARDEIDLGLLSFPQMEKDIVIEPLANGSYDVSVVLRRGNPLASQESLSLAELAGQRFSMLSDKFVLGQVMPQRCQQVGFEPEVAFTNDSWEVVLSSVAGLDTVALLPAPFEQLANSEDLAWVPLHDKASNFPIGIATRKGATLSPAAAEFAAAIRGG